jgi:hypothetical protein
MRIKLAKNSKRALALSGLRSCWAVPMPGRKTWVRRRRPTWPFRVKRERGRKARS